VEIQIYYIILKNFEINFGIMLKQNYLCHEEIWKNKFQSLIHKIGIFLVVQYLLQVLPTNRDNQSIWKAIGFKVEVNILPTS